MERIEVLKELAATYNYASWRSQVRSDGNFWTEEELAYLKVVCDRMIAGEFGIQRATNAFRAEFAHRNFSSVKQRLQSMRKKHGSPSVAKVQD